MTDSVVTDVAKRVREVAMNHSDVVGVYLFGSLVTDESHAGSDVDLGALFADVVGVDRKVSLQQELSEALEREVDLVDLATAGAFVALDAIRGERIFERDGLALDEFDLYVLRRAGDLAPFERERRRQVLQGS